VDLSHRGSPGHAQDAGRWMLSGAGGWVLSLLERDGGLVLGVGLFWSFFFLFFFHFDLLHFFSLWCFATFLN
jgi:hypothetical protein